jgi:hypothetical protein
VVVPTPDELQEFPVVEPEEVGTERGLLGERYENLPIEPGALAIVAAQSLGDPTLQPGCRSAVGSDLKDVVVAKEDTCGLLHVEDMIRYLFVAKGEYAIGPTKVDPVNSLQKIGILCGKWPDEPPEGTPLPKVKDSRRLADDFAPEESFDATANCLQLLQEHWHWADRPGIPDGGHNRLENLTLFTRRLPRACDNARLAAEPPGPLKVNEDSNQERRDEDNGW